MKIDRWTADISPSTEILKKLFKSQGLEGKEILISSGAKLVNQRTSMTEIIQILNGELIFNLTGTQFVLRTGDRIEIPSNTVYSYNNLKNENCTLLTATKL
jgi:quercetin dioxygenase-like cupin family protein